MNQQKYPALSAPQNLKATVQPGFIALGWEVVKDAHDGYEVYRADATTNESKLLATTLVPYLLDKVSFYNQLVDGRAYTYTVVAKGRKIGDDYVVLDGKASTNATANIPARSAGAITAAEAIKDIAHTTKIDPYGFEQVVVTWTGISHLDYTLRYYLGDEAFSLLPDYSSSNVEGWGGAQKAVVLPLVGGTTSVDITAAWDGGAAEYYPSATAPTHEIKATATLLPKVEGFSVDTATTGSYTLKWTATLGAIAYDIWKSELTGQRGSNAEDGTTAIGAWTAVGGTPTKNGNAYELVYTESDTSKTWVYAIVAKSATARSAGVATTIANASALTLPNVSNFQVQRAVSGDYTLTWNPVIGATGYTIQKAEIIGSNNTLGAWSNVEGDPARNGDTWTLLESGVDTAKSYIYSIIATNGNVKSTQKTVTPPVNAIFYTLADVNTFNVQTAVGGDYTLTWSHVTAATEYTIQKAEIIGANNTLGAWSAVSGTPTRNGDTWTLLESGVDTTKSYTYSIIAKNDDAESRNKATSVVDALSYTLGNVSNFQVQSAVSGVYTLTWSHVTAATEYTIQKAEIIGSNNTLGAWSNVEGTPIRNGDTWTLLESGVDTTKSYSYTIIAKNGDAESPSKTPSSPNPVSALSSSLITTTFSTASNIRQTKLNGEPRVTITLTVGDGESATLQRASASNFVNGVPTTIGDYEPVTSSTVGAHYTWIDNPTIRSSYAYKLILTKDGLTKEIVDYLNDGSYTPVITTTYLGIRAESAPANIYSIKISIGSDSGYPWYNTPLAYTDDLKADISQALTDSSGTPIGDWDQIATDQRYQDLFENGYIHTNGLTIGQYYQYRIELTSTTAAGTKTLTYNNSSGAIRPSVVSYLPSYTLKNNGTQSIIFSTGTQNAVGEADGQKLLLGAKLYVASDRTYNNGRYEYTLTSLQTTIDKAGASVLLDTVPAYNYYAYFSTAALNALNPASSTAPRTYYVVTESTSGGYTEIFSFTVDPGASRW